MGIDHNTLALASRQGGVVTRAQLLELNYGPGTVDWLVRSKSLLPVSNGVYRVVPATDHLDLVRSAVVALPQAVASHQSAAHLLRFPRLPEPLPTVAVPAHTTHTFPGVTVRRWDDLIRDETVQVDGIPCTNTPRTLFDLSRLLSDRHFDAIEESLLIAGRMTIDQFRETVDRLARRGKPGTKRSRAFLVARSGKAGTILERRGRAILASAGLPAPISEFPIPWQPGKRFDDAYPHARIAIEWDSRAWHSQQSAMSSDRARDRRAASNGWVVLRFMWDEVVGSPEQVAQEVATLLQQRAAS